MTKATKKTPAKKVKKVSAPKKTKKTYHFEIRVNDVVFVTDANDFETALLEFVDSPSFPVGAKTRAVLTYSKGKSLRTKILQTPMARRILQTIRFKGSALKVLAEKLTNDLA